MLGGNRPWSDQSAAKPPLIEWIPSPSSEGVEIEPPKGMSHLATDTRPANGTVYQRDFLDQSKGVLTIKNGLDRDAVIKLVKLGNCQACFYVRSGSSFSLDGIDAGSYSVFYGTGFGWDVKSQTFLRGSKAALFSQPVEYDTRKVPTPTGYSIYFDKVTLTLHKVEGGNTNTEDISPVDFDQL